MKTNRIRPATQPSIQSAQPRSYSQSMRKEANKTFQRILIPVDFSICSEKAMKFGLKLAEATGADVEILHIADLGGSGRLVGDSNFPEIEKHLHSRAEFNFRKWFEKITDTKTTHFRVRSGWPFGGEKVFKEILKEAERNKSDLIVMGRHGQSPLDRLFLGSTTERVLKLAPCPVLCV